MVGGAVEVVWRRRLGVGVLALHVIATPPAHVAVQLLPVHVVHVELATLRCVLGLVGLGDKAVEFRVAIDIQLALVGKLFRYRVARALSCVRCTTRTYADDVSAPLMECAASVRYRGILSHPYTTGDTVIPVLYRGILSYQYSTGDTLIPVLNRGYFHGIYLRYPSTTMCIPQVCG